MCLQWSGASALSVVALSDLRLCQAAHAHPLCPDCTCRVCTVYLQEVTAADGHSIFWWGIDIVDPAHSAAGPLEIHKHGDPRTW